MNTKQIFYKLNILLWFIMDNRVSLNASWNSIILPDLLLLNCVLWTDIFYILTITHMDKLSVFIVIYVYVYDCKWLFPNMWYACRRYKEGNKLNSIEPLQN
jgi:hypothetical protein